MISSTRFLTVAAPTTAWVESKIGAPSISRATVSTQSNVVMVQGTAVTGKSGFSELAVSIDPASLGRKLAVMRVAAELDGKALASTAATL